MNPAVRVSPIFLGLLALTGLGCALAAVDNQPVRITGIVLIVIGGWASSLCLHEFGHAITAYRGGDREVRLKGYLTLDPRRYTDPVLSIVLPLLFVALGGIPLPGGAVWINHAALRDRRTESVVSAAGPLANLLIGLALSLIVIFAPMPWGTAAGLSYLAFLQVIAFVLNILPIPGLDGYGLWEPWLSPQARRFGAQARPWAPLILVAAIFFLPGVGTLFFRAAFALYSLVGGEATLAITGMELFRFWL
ncbi:site-2 protease family protein [Salinifilum aidingensis]